ncbi:carbohydrate-binding protein [Slackia isoflavoniconvertens]|uniref:carbohydrate-binding protein n=1 Tax=Slackia isoflavoniconvertens TaxID=572010 RepID=UPI003AF0A4EF
MSIYIKVNQTEYPAAVNGVNNDRTWDGRDTKTITLTMTHAEVAALLPDNTPWSIVQRETVDVLDEQGQPTGQTKEVVNEYDNSAYSLAGDITDHRDGTVSIKMGKPTDAENAVGAVVALTGEVVTVARAAELRPMIEAAATSLPDSDAAKAVELFPTWAYPISYVVGNRVSDGGKLYKCRQAHTSQEGWKPAATPALWVVVDITHAGTQADPIPAARGMEYEYGKYYLDSEDGKTYKCERTGEAAGGKIVLQYLPHELVRNYFTAG